MKNFPVISLILIFCISAFALRQVSQHGYWIEAQWLPDGSILLTGPKYRGIYLRYSDNRLDTVTDDWKAGYKPAYVPNLNAIAFSGTPDIDKMSSLSLYSFDSGEISILSSDGDFGPPILTAGDGICAFDGGKLRRFDESGNETATFDCGAYVTVSVGSDFAWCDRSGVAYIYRIKSGKTESLEYSGSATGRLFNPIPSPDGDFVLFEELGGPMVLVSASDLSVTELQVGDYPVFIEKPYGILFLETTDDGEKITDSRVMFLPITDSEPGVAVGLIASSPPDAIVTRADYSPKFGLLLTTQDGDVFVEKLNIVDKLK